MAFSGVLIVLGWLSAFIVLLPRLRRWPPAGRANGPPEPVSVIIPARNEERNLPRLLESLNGQSRPPAEILVVNDHSEDRTREVAQAHGARVIDALPLPAGWTGKTWACRQGAAAAAGRVLLFLDADTWLAPDGLSRLLDAWRERPGPLSVQPWHRTETAGEQVSAVFNLVVAAGAPAFGPCLLIGRTDYERAGGHDAVRGQVLENVFLARGLAAGGRPVRARVGRGVLYFRMYPGGWREAARGWSKAFARGAMRTPAWRLALIVLWITGLVEAVFLLGRAAAGTAPLVPAAALYLLSALQLDLHLRGVGRFQRWTAGLFPLPLVVFLTGFTASLLRPLAGRPVRWKGRDVGARSAP